MTWCASEPCHRAGSVASFHASWQDDGSGGGKSPRGRPTVLEVVLRSLTSSLWNSQHFLTISNYLLLAEVVVCPHFMATWQSTPRRQVGLPPPECGRGYLITDIALCLPLEMAARSPLRLRPFLLSPSLSIGVPRDSSSVSCETDKVRLLSRRQPARCLLIW